MGAIEKVASKFNGKEINEGNAPHILPGLLDEVRDKSCNYSPKMYEESMKDKEEPDVVVTADDIRKMIQSDTRDIVQDTTGQEQDIPTVESPESPYEVDNRSLLRNPLLSGFNQQGTELESRPEQER